MSKSSGKLWQSLSSGRQLIVIAGPCVVESEKLCRTVARQLKVLAEDLGFLLVFKASYDKANRSSAGSFRGIGIQAGLEILKGIRKEFTLPVLTDVHTENQAHFASEYVDILQIPAFLCRQTDLIQAAAVTGKILNIKKGQFLSPSEMRWAVEKAREVGGQKVLLTERGTTFGYKNLVADMRSIPLMRQTGCPVVFDATHSVQLPGAGPGRSAGQREFAPVLAQAAVAAGADGVFIETHPNPDQALSDGPNMIPLLEMGKLLKRLIRIREACQE